MTSLALGVVLSSFFASSVEFVEALTIVLAVGITRQWRASLLGAGAAIVVLAVIVFIAGRAIIELVPIDALRLIVGALLIVFGLQWLTKAVERASGLRAQRNELAIFQHEMASLRDEPAVASSGTDWFGFTLSFKSVLLEGLEVAFIVITLGVSSGNLASAAFGAAGAAAIVLLAGALFRCPLERVPENALKFAVGLLLTTFGTFWAGEGLGLDWPGSDLAILALLAGYAAVALIGVRHLGGDRRRRPPRASSLAAVEELP